MTFEEFELKFAELVAKYGFVKDTWHFGWKPDKDYYVNRTELPGKPDAFVSYEYNPNSDKKLYVDFNSVLYYIAPTGVDSFTSKDHSLNYKDCDQFKWYSMSFKDADKGEYEPDFDLLAKYADEMLKQYKHQVLVSKLLRIKDDF